MPRTYKYTRLPEGYCTLARAVRVNLPDLELFEIEGKLIFTDDIQRYLLGEDMTGSSLHEFSSHEEFEDWLLDTATEWIKNHPTMLEALDERLKLA